MADFEVKVQRIFIKPHTNADSLDLGNIGSPDGWQVVVKKGLYQSGDLVVYVGENSVVPEWVLRKHGFWNTEKNVGILAGKQGNRVKAIRLRGAFSLGICLKVESSQDQGYYFLENETSRITFAENSPNHLSWKDLDLSAFLGITKYEPPIPTQMAGEVCNVRGNTLSYDIENIKKYPNVFVEGEDTVYITEKLHGTWLCLSYVPGLNHPDLLDGNFFAASKGMSAQGLVFKENDKNKTNIYVRILHTNMERLRKIAKEIPEPIYVLGEVFGKGVQDLTYGLDKPEFRVFDIYIGSPGNGKYLSVQQLINFCAKYDLEKVPHIASGTFTKKLVELMTNGKETISHGTHIREGIVIKPLDERTDPELGRVILKSVSEDYLLRKGNVTEFN